MTRFRRAANFAVDMVSSAAIALVAVGAFWVFAVLILSLERA